MDKRIKFAFIAIIGVICFTVLILYNFGLLFESSQLNGDNEDGVDGSGSIQKNVSNIDLIVDYSNGSKKTRENFSLTDNKTTVFDALIKWCDVEYDNYGEMGYLVTSIDGKEGNWLYYVNGEYANIAANKYNLNDGDKIEWIYKS